MFIPPKVRGGNAETRKHAQLTPNDNNNQLWKPVMRFEEYSGQYSNIAMRREDGILEVRLHTLEDSFQWSLKAQAELLSAFREISADTENRIVILAGTGDRKSVV